MYLTITIFIVAILVLAAILFIPISVKIPTKKGGTRELSEFEDLREYPMEDSFDVEAHYHSSSDDAVK